MEPEQPEINIAEPETAAPEPKRSFPAWPIAASIVALFGIGIYGMGADTVQNAAITARVAPAASEGAAALSIRWGSLGADLAAAGVIDRPRFESLYSGTLAQEAKQLLGGGRGENLVITRENAGLVLNLLWAFGLANKNPILEQGPMSDPRYGGAGRFASTGGWSIAVGNAMDHYSRYEFVKLTAEEQALVERVSQGIYRPCCDNSTYFPDCNHGMAMLGLLELLAAQGATENELFRAALAVNSLWFPDTYANIKRYVEQNGTPWDAVDPQLVLGREYSSGSGYQNIVSRIIAPQAPSGGSCGV